MASRRDLARREAEEAAHRRRVEDAEANSRSPLGAAEKEERWKAAAAGYAGGLAPGAARGAYTLVQDLTNFELTYPRIANPFFDTMFSPPGKSLSYRAGALGLSALGTTFDHVTHPAKLIDDVRGFAADQNAKLNPMRSYAPSVEAQRQRAYEAGKNAGEAIFNLAMPGVAGQELRFLRELGHFGPARTVESYLAEGYPERVAKDFARPYVPGQGSHFMPQRWGLPRLFTDSPFNRTLPAPDATKGEMMKFHALADDHLRGGNMKGGGGWSVRQLGWVPPSLPARLWRGLPLPTKLVGFGGVAAAGSGVSGGRTQR